MEKGLPSQRGVGVLAYLLESAQALPLLLLLHVQVGEAHELMNGFIHLLIQRSWAWALEPGEGGGKNEPLRCQAPPLQPLHPNRSGGTASWVRVWPWICILTLPCTD